MADPLRGCYRNDSHCRLRRAAAAALALVSAYPVRTGAGNAIACSSTGPARDDCTAGRACRRATFASIRRDAPTADGFQRPDRAAERAALAA